MTCLCFFLQLSAFRRVKMVVNALLPVYAIVLPPGKECSVKYVSPTAFIFYDRF